ncbi:MAG: UMP kinase, partial [Synergistaceae bacterium]|nr:UMP kinase [Synergistaceae bacterium]
MPKYNRVLLKLSGEVLAGKNHIGIDFGTVRDFAAGLAEIRNAGIELSLVIGGGNMLRGRDAEELGYDRVSLDSIGMLGTVMNALAVKTALEKINVPAKVLSAISMPPVAEL